MLSSHVALGFHRKGGKSNSGELYNALGFQVIEAVVSGVAVGRAVYAYSGLHRTKLPIPPTTYPAAH